MIQYVLIYTSTYARKRGKLDNEYRMTMHQNQPKRVMKAKVIILCNQQVQTDTTTNGTS